MMRQATEVDVEDEEEDKTGPWDGISVPRSIWSYDAEYKPTDMPEGAPPASATAGTEVDGEAEDTEEEAEDKDEEEENAENEDMDER